MQKLQFIHGVNGGGSKTTKIIKKVNVMLSNMTSLMIFAVCDVSTMDKLQFLVLIYDVLLSKLLNVSLCCRLDVGQSAPTESRQDRVHVAYLSS